MIEHSQKILASEEKATTTTTIANYELKSNRDVVINGLCIEGLWVKVVPLKKKGVGWEGGEVKGMYSSKSA